jgi:sugar lactone lactonase YvrE
MLRTAKHGAPGAGGRRVVGPLLLVALMTALAAPAAAAPAAEVILLPGASSAEGIAAAGGASFYAGDLFRGDIFRGDLHHGTVERFIHALPGRMAVGMAADPTHRLLFVAGGFGHAYVYDTATGATVAAYRLADPAGSFVNDVTLTHQGAWFTDSLQAQLYFIPVSPLGVPGPPRTLALRGPAADTGGAVNLNGIAATPDGTTLIVGHTGNGELYTVDPATGASARIVGVSVSNVDGLLLEGGGCGRCRTATTSSPGSGCART